MEKIRVLIIHNDAVNTGGAGRSLDELLDVLIEYAYVCVVLPDHGTKEQYLINRNIRCKILRFACDIDMNNKCEKKIIDNYRAARELKSYVIKNKFDVIHTNSSISNVGMFLSVMTGIPHVWHIRECLHRHYGYKYCNEKLKKVLFHLSDGIISISDTVCKYMFNRYGIESTTIYNGIRSDKYLIDVDRDHMEDSFYFAGTVTADKGIWIILEAVKYIKLKFKKNIRIIIAGDRQKKIEYATDKYVEKYGLEDCVKFVGFQADLKHIRATSEYCIVASRFEALSRSTIEAMLAGNLIIATDAGGTRELIGNNERGVLFKSENYIDLVNKIMFVISMSKSQKDEIRYKAQRYAVREFDVRKSVNSVLHVYENVLNGKCDSQTNEKSRKKLLKEMYEILHAIGDLKETVNNVECIKDFNKNIIARRVLDYLNRNKLDEISIYGIGEFGRFLLDYLIYNGIKIKYVIDKDSMGLEYSITVFNPNENWPHVNLIINTVTQGYLKVDKLIDSKGLDRMGISDFL